MLEVNNNDNNGYQQNTFSQSASTIPTSETASEDLIQLSGNPSPTTKTPPKNYLNNQYLASQSHSPEYQLPSPEAEYIHSASNHLPPTSKHGPSTSEHPLPSRVPTAYLRMPTIPHGAPH
ncbi:hypothetical protein L873DRAFT_1800803 [Choiromyces venosus 120613-1]|uniref:Uncharacterized protein n=1 Tax=Choiromyces venosus 120613-1 TaxID=1336337 RepID=A0A3N4JY13_9PEZI|nr:hypothetical protein L873DRAFT_1800803 [Choiromyces venosus 120613-1]